MRKNDSKRYVLMKILAVSTGLVTICAFFGPYDYQFESIEGLLYYYLTIILLGIPLLFCGNKNRALLGERHSKGHTYELTLNGEKILMTASLAALLGAVVFSAECIRLFSLDAILAGGDFRLAFGELRSTLSKYAEILACLGPASYLIASRLDNVKHKTLMPLAILSLIAIGLTGLVLGARWKIFLCVLLLVFSTYFNGRSGSRVNIKMKEIVRTALIFALIAFVIYAFYVLFSVRGMLSADELYRFYLGDMPLKPWAAELIHFTGGAIGPIYKAIDYIGQSPFVFTFLYEYYIPDQLYLGAFALRILGYILPPLGIPFPILSDIVESTFTGMYSGSSYGFITDFGVLFAPAVMFAVGMWLAAVERRRTLSRLSAMFFPLACSMITCSPIYYLLHVGYTDYIFWLFLALYGVLAMTRAWVSPSASIDQSSCVLNNDAQVPELKKEIQVAERCRKD